MPNADHEARDLRKSQKRSRGILERITLRKRLIDQMDARKTPPEIQAYVLREAGQSEAWRLRWWIDAVICNTPSILAGMSVARNKHPR